jgi:hypothetical protein
MLDLVDLEGRREPGRVPARQGGFDLIWDGGATAGFDRPTSLPSLLGCANPSDRTQARRPLAPARAEDTAAAAAAARRPRLTAGDVGSASGGSGGGDDVARAARTTA